LNVLKEAIKEGKRGFELMEEHTKVCAMYPRFVHSYIRAYEESLVLKENFIPRDGWQSDLVTKLSEIPDSRSINWYYDLQGNKGKSYFCRNYTGTNYYVTGGKSADIFYGYQYEPVVFFDLARMKQDIVQYDVMEAFKNGQFYSTKYESKLVRFNVPHVVVFANFYPDTSKLSSDRWNIIEI